MSEKLSRKEIREPDAFQRVSSAYWAKAMEYRKLLGIGLLALLGVLLAAALLSRAAENKRDAAGAALAKALETSRRGVEGAMDLGADPEAPKFKSREEKNTELAKQLDEVRAQFPGTPAATTATLLLGDARYQLGKLDEAAKAYEEYLAASDAGDPMRVLAHEGLGYVAEAQKNWEKARASFERMGKEAAGEPLKAQAAYQLARVLEESGQKQQAADAYEKVRADFKESASARAASERLALLATQGVVPAVKPEPQAAKAEQK